jgi:polar amino acid transport system substrate-binding protein
LILRTREIIAVNLMRKFQFWMLLAVFALLTGCGTLAPDAAARQALAPTGKLRVGMYPGSPTSFVVDPKSGEKVGVTLALGRELASRLGVPFEPIEYRLVAEVVEALKTGAIDFTFTNASAARAKIVDFTPALLDLELGYLVMPGSPVTRATDIDQPGRRIGVSQGSTSQATLSREFKNAALVPAASLKIAGEMLAERKLDAYATNKAILFEMMDKLPGARVLDGRWGLEHLAIAIPQGRGAGMPYLRQFAEDTKASGLLQAAVEKAGLRGAVKAGGQ